jgi:5-methylcytosine-specific restriction endonuclease McrA
MAGFGLWDEGTSRKPFAQRDRAAVWDREFGPDVDRAKCPICQRNEIQRDNFAMGHKKALAKGGSNSLKNLRPICTSCNSKMSSMTMDAYIKKFVPHAKENPKSKSTAKKTTKKAAKKSTGTKKRRQRRPNDLMMPTLSDLLK